MSLFGIGGKQASNSSSVDARGVADNGGIAQTGQGSSLAYSALNDNALQLNASAGSVINMTDQGAFAAALQFAAGADQRLGDLQADLLTAGKGLLETASTAVDTSSADRKTLLYVLAAVVAVVVFKGL